MKKYDIFVSHSSADGEFVKALVARLENIGIRCWYALRDISDGADWDEATTEAIDTSQFMLVLVSKSSNKSKNIMKELCFAIEHDCIILPIKLDDVEISNIWKYHLDGKHWTNAYDLQIDEQVQSVMKCLKEYKPCFKNANFSKVASKQDPNIQTQQHNTCQNTNPKPANNVGEYRHDVFISYVSQDKAFVVALVHSLEKNGIRCWYAHRDISADVQWSSAIAEVIGETHIALFVFSRNSCDSSQIKQELQIAIKSHCKIFLVKRDDAHVSSALENYLSHATICDMQDFETDIVCDLVLADVKHLLNI